MLCSRDILIKLKDLGLPQNSESVICISEPTKLGVTNSYCFISINGKPSFVYRVPGKQWCCGFDRDTEFHNLNLVKKSGVQTGVVGFDPATGAQLSTHSEPTNISSEISDLEYAASALKSVHSTKSYMKNDYNIISTILSSYGRISELFNQQLFATSKPIVERMMFSIINACKNVVASHNEPFPTNFRIGVKKDYRMEDWEYSGNNFRYWDLAFLSVKSKLTLKQDAFLLNVYFGNQLKNETVTEFHVFKVIIQFTLMLWMASPLGRGNVDADNERLTRISNEELVLAQLFQQMHATISPRKFHFLFREKEAAVEAASTDKHLVTKIPKFIG